MSEIEKTGSTDQEPVVQDAPEEDTEGQSLQNYELARAITRERANEAARLARDAARAREAREAKRR